MAKVQSETTEDKKKREFASIKIKRSLLHELKVLSGGKDVSEFAAELLQKFVDKNLEKQAKALEEQLEAVRAKLKKEKETN